MNRKRSLRFLILFACAALFLCRSPLAANRVLGQESLDATSFRASFETPPPGYGEVPF